MTFKYHDFSFLVFSSPPRRSDHIRGAEIYQQLNHVHALCPGTGKYSRRRTPRICPFHGRRQILPKKSFYSPLLACFLLPFFSYSYDLVCTLRLFQHLIFFFTKVSPPLFHLRASEGIKKIPNECSENPVSLGVPFTSPFMERK